MRVADRSPVLAGISLLPNTACNKAFLPKDFIHQHTKVMNFMVVNTNEDNTIFPQQISREIQSRIHHVQPLGVEAAICFGIRAELLPLGVHLPRVLQVGLQAFGVVVGVDKIIAGIIRGINVDHLDLAEIRLLQELQHFQVVAFDDEILSCVKINAFLTAGA